MAIVTLYHGSTDLFDRIEIRQGRPYKDFGPGFYTTQRKTHAESLAKRNGRIRNCKELYLYTYQFDEDWFGQFHTKIFEEADMEWINFILLNRNSRTKQHHYDIVKGSTANDNTSLCISAYLDGLYGETGSYNARLKLLEFLEIDKLPLQIYFGSESAADLLNQNLVERSTVQWR